MVTIHYTIFDITCKFSPQAQTLNKPNNESTFRTYARKASKRPPTLILSPSLSQGVWRELLAQVEISHQQTSFVSKIKKLLSMPLSASETGTIVNISTVTMQKNGK